MGEKYSHLNKTERNLIKNWHDRGVSLREIGRRLERSHSTISRELRRNLWCGRHYYFLQAQTFYEQRPQRRARRMRLKTEFIRGFVREKLSIGWTPEIIAGRLKRTMPDHAVCHESIYQFIYIEANDLIQCLPRKHLKRRSKHPYRKSGVRIKDRLPITERPEEAESRSTLGHWESDTVVGGDRKSGLNVIVERASRLVNISYLAEKTAKQTSCAIIKRLKRHDQNVVKTITYDNGSENVLHTEVNEKLKAQSFFCAPYHSWEKGSVEQVNGLIRRFFPKGTDFSAIKSSDIHRVEKLLNNRPRKCLNYQTPYEVFRNGCGALTD